MDFGMQTTLIKQIFSEARVSGTAMGPALTALNLGERLQQIAGGGKATVAQVGDFRALLLSASADGVLTDSEIQALVTSLTKSGLQLVHSGQTQQRVDIDDIVLPDF